MKVVICFDHRSNLSFGRLSRSLLALTSQPRTSCISLGVPSTSNFSSEIISLLGIGSSDPANGHIKTYAANGQDAACRLITLGKAKNIFTISSTKQSPRP